MARMLYQGHGSYRFTLASGMIVYVDPFAGTGYDLPANLIVVTHEHFDHTAVNKMPHAQDVRIIRAAEAHPTPNVWLTFDVPYTGTSATTTPAVRICAVPAQNANHPIDECVGYVLEFDGIKFYASGDTSTTRAMQDGTLAALNLDWAVFPCDGFYNMGPAEAAECARLCGAVHNIPIHTVPIDNPNDPAQLFSLDSAQAFNAPGRVIVRPGEEIVL